MCQESELSRLEQFVGKLLSQFSALRREKNELEQKLAEQTERIEQLQSTLSSSDTRQIEVSQRLGSLVARIEQWEQEFEEKEVVQDVEPVVEQEEEAVIDDFSTAPLEQRMDEAVPVAEVSAEEKEAREDGRVQHNLFSLGGPRS